MALQNEKKAAIRERYKGVDPSLLEVIPATAPETMAVEDRTLNVAAYIRVSTDNDEQTSSFELQQNDFTERIAGESQEKYGFHVSHLNIAKTKRKCGIIERQNYNLPKSEDSRSPKTPKEKEEAIIEAFKRFQMI